MGHQLANMAMLYVLIGLLNKRARKAGDNAARQVGSSSSTSSSTPSSSLCAAVVGLPGLQLLQAVVLNC